MWYGYAVSEYAYESYGTMSYGYTVSEYAYESYGTRRILGKIKCDKDNEFVNNNSDLDTPFTNDFCSNNSIAFSN